MIIGILLIVMLNSIDIPSELHYEYKIANY